MNLIEELEAEIGAAADLRNPEVVQAAFDLASRIPTLNSLVGIYAKRLADMRLTIPAQVRWCPNCLYPENANSFASMLYKYQQEQMKLTKLRRADIALSRIDGQVEWLVRRRQALKMIWPCKDCMEKYNPTGRSNHKEPHTYPANVNWRRGRKVPGGWETSQEQQDRTMRNSILPTASCRSISTRKSIKRYWP